MTNTPTKADLPNGWTYGPVFSRTSIVRAKWWQRCGEFERIGRHRYRRMYGEFRAIIDDEGTCYDIVEYDRDYALERIAKDMDDE